MLFQYQSSKYTAKFSVILTIFLVVWLTTPLITSAASCQVPTAYASIQTAVNDPACDTITLAAGFYFENVTVSRSVTIIGSGNLESVIDGNAAGTVLTIQPGLDVTLENLVIQNGLSQLGGGIFNDGSQLLLDIVVLMSNAVVPVPVAPGAGGGLYNNGGDVVVKDSAIVGNHAIQAGGGIYNTGSLTIDHTYLSNGTVVLGGGSLYNEASGDVVIQYSTFDRGGGSIATHIFNSGGSIQSHASLYTGGGGPIQNHGHFVSGHDSFTNNQAGRGSGGAIVNGGTLELEHCLFENNGASFRGGAISNTGTTTISNCTLVNNTTNGDGGAIFNSGDLNITLAAVVDNSAGGNGGGIANSSALFVEYVTFFGNQAAAFDDIWNTGSCTGCPS